MTLYKTGAASITVTDGTLNNGTGLAVTVSAATASSLSLRGDHHADGRSRRQPHDHRPRHLWQHRHGLHRLAEPDLRRGQRHRHPLPDRHQRLGHGDVQLRRRTRPSPSTPDRPPCPGRSNGVMTLYKAGAASITVTDGTLNNGTGLSVTVGAATAPACRSARRPPRRRPEPVTTSRSPPSTPMATPPRATRVRRT